MKKSILSQIAVLCGLALGVMALWAGAAPIGVSGDQVIGGWYGYDAHVRVSFLCERTESPLSPPFFN